MCILKKVELAIKSAITNEENCPICDAPIIVVGFDHDSQVDIYAHDCECLLEATSYEPPPFEGYNIDYNLNDFVPDEFEYSYCVYEDDEIFIFEDGELIQKKFYPENSIKSEKRYKSKCHHCLKGDGVDSEDENCTKDHPYGYRCRYCQHSLRTHYYYGEGEKFDMANLNTTWYFDEYKNPKLFN